MTIYRCDNCGFIQEVLLPHKSSSNCSQCNNEVKIYDTALYVRAILDYYFQKNNELEKLQAQYQALKDKNKHTSEIINEEPQIAVQEQTTSNEAPINANLQLPPQIAETIKEIVRRFHQPIPLSVLGTEIKTKLPSFNQKRYGFPVKFSDFIRKLNFLQIDGVNNDMMVRLKNNNSATNNTPSLDIDINNSVYFATEEQHEKIRQYLTHKNISAEFNYNAVNFTGYFDEAAELIAENYSLLEKHLATIRYLYNQHEFGFSVNVKNVSQLEEQRLRDIFKTLFDYRLFAKYFYYRVTKTIHIKLSESAIVQKFFCGEWLEWFATVKLIKYAESKKMNYSIARAVNVQLLNGDRHEFDVIFLLEGAEALFIECKTGKFRQDVDKFLRICNKIDIDTKNWIVLAAQLDNTKAKAFEEMYPVRFCTIESFLSES